MSKKKKATKKEEVLVSWNELKVGSSFLVPGGMYSKLSENRAFWFNAHTEIDVDKDENKDNKVFTRIEEDG